MPEQYRINTPEQIFSPGLVVFRDLVERNIQTMISMAGGVSRLRPHCKTHKMPEVVRMLLELGITKHKAATIAECEMLAETGVRDIFLAYNLVGPNIDRAVTFRRRFPEVQFAVTADDLASIELLGKAMTEGATAIDVVLDINPGRDRTGLPLGEQALRRAYQLIGEMDGLNPGGFHLYDGHLREADLPQRRAAVNAFWQEISAFRDQLVERGLSVPKIVCGGTPTFPAYCQIDDPAIELSPGTCIFHDVGYGNAFPDLNAFTPAELVLTRVISRPTDNRITFDVGTKGVAADPPMGERVFLPELPDAVQVLQNEEHLVVETDQASKFKPGDWTLAIPRHVCPTSALYQSATVISNGEIIGEWEVVARDRKLSI